MLQYEAKVVDLKESKKQHPWIKPKCRRHVQKALGLGAGLVAHVEGTCK